MKTTLRFITPGQALRLLSIQRVLIRHGLDEIVFATHLFRPVRFLFYLLPWNWFRRSQASRAERMRMALEDLGPIYVKFGQLLSTRGDLLPQDMAAEFSRLQDHVPPFPGDQARAIIEQALGGRLEDHFHEFDDTPLASASIAQVHAAVCHDGRRVIVKVVRPGIGRTIRRDLGLIWILAQLAEKYAPGGHFMRPTNVVREFERTIWNELDLLREAASASQLRRNFIDSDVLYVPEVHWDLSHHDVLVMERISGIPVRDVEALEAAGMDLKWLAEAGIEAFFTMVFRDSFFHADMHPGNIFVSHPEADKPPRFILVDFGIMSSLSEYDQRYLAENFLAFLDRDYQRVAELHVESGWVPPYTRVDEFEFAIRSVCEPLLDRPMREISIGDLLLRLFQTARQFNMEILPQLLLLQKTLVNVEGLGRSLYADVDLWQTARPLLDSWMNERLGVRGLYKSTKRNLPLWIDRLPSLPNKAIHVLERLHENRLQMEMRSDQLDDIKREIRRHSQRTIYAVSGSVFVLAAAVIFGLDSQPAMFAGIPAIAWLLGLGGLGLLFVSLRE
ncbi:ubiquinone biosynthesis protein [Methylohalomonas lacus]|uniref:Ubiquinone biosynthesis protein n=1 Tax=Methylohalomonas lacus TaxID=398773 RepID=A0AAE3HMA7_9GAMM|nr:ubiquinone biosynthesis regulatory protein kinase UbiB [Methylohalomonas lacus]MCS3903933.1 ubiquinone biosynthesis protein [Methylohalomonas lacus]